MTLVSILTTVYNGYEFLEECAKSIYLQQCEHEGRTVLEWEWWIGVNGHGEGGEALLTAHRVQQGRPNVHVVNMPDVSGRVEALNRVASFATGEWIAILDCDDTWQPEKLITQVMAIQMSPKPIDVLGTFCDYMGDMSGAPVLPSGWISREMVAKGNPIINSSVMLRRELATWEDRFGLEDYDLWIRLSKERRAIFTIPHILVHHRIHKASAFNGTGRQKLPELRAFYGLEPPRPTVVSAYYPVPSKCSVEQYVDWIGKFWPKMQCNLVFYTDPELVKTFERLFKGRGGQTRVIGVPFPSLAAFEKLSPLVWKAAARLDTESGHTPELYALWYEKKEFVMRAIRENPFQSTEFIWCDAGIGREPKWIPVIQGFPAPERIPRGEMLVLEIDPFLEEDCVADSHGIYGSFGTRATIGGGILASDIGGWIRWSKAYDAMLVRYCLADRFIGKDQNIMGSMILEDPSIALLVKRPPALGPIRGWFYLLFFLAGLDIV